MLKFDFLEAGGVERFDSPEAGVLKFDFKYYGVLKKLIFHQPVCYKKIFP